jgi:serine/threonine protein kinase
MHQLGWIHGDLKQSIFDYMKTHAGSLILKANKQPTAPNLTATPHYMAPELFHGQAKNSTN